MSDHYIHSFTGDPARAYGTECYCKDGKSEERTFQVKYRGTICQIADWVGYVPGLGTAVGVARMAVSAFVSIGCLFAAGSIMLVSAFSSDDEKKHYENEIKKVYVVMQRARDEFSRGTTEIIPIINWDEEQKMCNLGSYFSCEEVGINEEGTVVYKSSSSKWILGSTNNKRAAGPVYYVNEQGGITYPWMEFNRFNDELNGKKETPLKTFIPGIKIVRTQKN